MELLFVSFCMLLFTAGLYLCVILFVFFAPIWRGIRNQTSVQPRSEQPDLHLGVGDETHRPFLDNPMSSGKKKAIEEIGMGMMAGLIGATVIHSLRDHDAGGSDCGSPSSSGDVQPSDANPESFLDS